MHISATSLDETARVEGIENGGSISVIVSRNQPGEGTRLHVHPYDETWVVQSGQVTFQAGDAIRLTGPGDIVNVPAGTPHKFTNAGPEKCELICIHPSATIIEEHLE